MKKPRTRAVAHFERTGCIIPGHQAEIAGYLAERGADYSDNHEHSDR